MGNMAGGVCYRVYALVTLVITDQLSENVADDPLVAAAIMVPMLPRHTTNSWPTGRTEGTDCPAPGSCIRFTLPLLNAPIFMFDGLGGEKPGTALKV